VKSQKKEKKKKKKKKKENAIQNEKERVLLANLWQSTKRGIKWCVCVRAP